MRRFIGRDGPAARAEKNEKGEQGDNCPVVHFHNRPVFVYE